MSYSSYPIAGLTIVGNRDFDYWSSMVALSGTLSTDPPVTESFDFDDTCFGALPAGVTPRLASCSNGPLAQVWVEPIVEIGIGVVFDDPLSGIGGTIDALSVTMGGVAVDLADENQSVAASGLVTFAPRSMNVHEGPKFWLLRPESLRWAGQDVSNDANRTIWHTEEIESVRTMFTITAPTLHIWYAWHTVGWSSP